MGIVFRVIIGAFIILVLAPVLLLSYILYRIILVRTKPEKWGRVCSMPEDLECRQMFEQGKAWMSENSANRQSVTLVSDGLKLAGEYFDFGYKKAVIIIAGRTESCIYSCYFAEPFKKAGFNVLAIDSRAHGLSEGKRSSLGYKEYRDVLKWSALLHDKMGVEEIILHGICIGSSTALFAMTSEDCPDYISAMLAEGMYSTFGESFKNHMLEDKRPIFPIYYAAMLQIRLLSGANVITDGPIYRIDKLTKPILFLHSERDVYSLPEDARRLYDKCIAQKHIHWFSEGEHSRIRAKCTGEYDGAVSKFLSELKNNS